jgi:hypothetical protein
MEMELLLFGERREGRKRLDDAAYMGGIRPARYALSD